MWKAIDKSLIFFNNIFTALKFAAFDYDVVLRRTKTTKQRIIIWLSIFMTIIGLVFGSLFILNYYIKTIINSRLIK
ncbi:conserved hypothetical protein [Candidatus Roizmanbacteria bacterium]|nr:conserved hypothetical protein [Candidatus Roizmanbacteria bacterium]